MSLGATDGWPGAVVFGNWSVESLGICHFTTSASITEYWQGMVSVLINFLDLIRLRTYWCTHHYEFRNHSEEVCWYEHWQLVCGQFGYVTLHYKCFHHGVLARNARTENIRRSKKTRTKNEGEKSKSKKNEQRQ